MGSQQGQAELQGNPESPGQLRTDARSEASCPSPIFRNVKLVSPLEHKHKIHHISKHSDFGGYNLTKAHKIGKDENGFVCCELLEPRVPAPASTTGHKFL